MTARRRFEIASHGVDEFLGQGHATDPFGGTSWTGLRVPFAPTAAITPPGTPSFASRYLFMGAAFSVADGSVARIVGYRQLLTLGTVVQSATSQALIPQELDVEAPEFAFIDATVSWHFRRLGPPNAQGLPSFRPSNKTDGVSFRKGFSMQPALLYHTITLPAGNPYYTNLTAYQPPNAGRPYGAPLTDNPELSNVKGLVTDWKTPDALGSLDVEVRGPDTVCAFISVAQTDPNLSQGVPAAFTNPGNAGLGISREQAFIQNANLGYETPVFYWRVGVSLIVEVDSLVSEVRERAGRERK